MVGGDHHGNCRPAQDPCKELATGVSKGALETQPKQEWATVGPALALPLSLWRMYGINHTCHTASVFSC